MGNKKRNYSRFYALCKSMGVDLELYKEDLVSQFTQGRTTSLREMTDSEYDEMCDCIRYGRHAEGGEAYIARRRKSRSAVLNRIQRLGIDTTDFSKVNGFCQNRRIAGKPFGMLTADELDALIPKLEAMLSKPKPRPKESAAQVRTLSVPIVIYSKPNQLPN